MTIYQHKTIAAKGDLLDDSLYEGCTFENIEAEGSSIYSSIFINCSFSEVDLYWCQAFRSVFVNTSFINCDLRGNFDEARFLDCSFINCLYGDHNLGGATTWDDAIAIGCHIEGDPLPLYPPLFPQKRLLDLRLRGSHPMNINPFLIEKYFLKYQRCTRLMKAMGIGLIVLSGLFVGYWTHDHFTQSALFGIGLLIGLLLTLPALTYAIYLSILHWKDFTDHEEGRKILIFWLVASCMVIGIPLVLPAIIVYFAMRVYPDLIRLNKPVDAPHANQEGNNDG